MGVIIIDGAFHEWLREVDGDFGDMMVVAGGDVSVGRVLWWGRKGWEAELLVVIRDHRYYNNKQI